LAVGKPKERKIKNSSLKFVLGRGLFCAEEDALYEHSKSPSRSWLSDVNHFKAIKPTFMRRGGLGEELDVEFPILCLRKQFPHVLSAAKP
jgi:hypothetical protein